MNKLLSLHTGILWMPWTIYYGVRFGLALVLLLLIRKAVM